MSASAEDAVESSVAGPPEEPKFFAAFVAPALWMFLVPALAFGFFQWAEHQFDTRARKAVLANIAASSLTAAEKRQASAQVRDTSFTRLAFEPAGIQIFHPDDIARLRIYRWMIWLAAGSVILGVGGFGIAAACAVVFRGTATKLYWGLTIGWNVLRLVSALQVAAQATLAVALSFWVTALWFDVYVPQLIFFIGLAAAVGVIAVVRGIFKRAHMDVQLQGKLVTRDRAPHLWERLESICQRVGTSPPDSVVAGIDDNFFVTEQPLMIGDQQRRGRTLYVSLSLLRQLDGSEADAVMAHEMAHFSGKDTTFSNRVNPLLARYDVYLLALYEGVVTIPVYYFMLCFRAMYEYNLGSHSREREFRADRIAGDASSPRSLAAALMKIVAFSHYRAEVERTLFEQHDTEEISNIAGRVEEGFDEFAASFAKRTQELGLLRNSHPFDSHPPVAERFERLGVAFAQDSAAAMLSVAGDGAWFEAIEEAEAMERGQWEQYETEFRNVHEQSLCYRFLPENDQEREIVLKYFPALSFDTKAGPIELDCDRIVAPRWDGPVLWSAVENAAMHDADLHVQIKDVGARVIKTKSIRGPQQAARFLEAFGAYYGRFMAAAQWQQERAEQERAEQERAEQEQAEQEQGEQES